MNIVSEKEMVFRNEHNGRVYHSIGLSKKLQDGTYEKGYMNCRFRKGVDVPNMTRIRITNGWIDFYNSQGKTVPTVFISEFDYLDENINNDFGFDSSLDGDSDLPF